MLTRFVAAVGLLGSLATVGSIEPLYAQTPPGPVIISELMWVYDISSVVRTRGYVGEDSLFSNECLTRDS